MPDSSPPRERKGRLLITVILVAVVVGAIGWYAVTTLRTWNREHIIHENESAAVGVLRNLVAAETTWRQNDMDGNGVLDYWVADIWGLYARADKYGNPAAYFEENKAKVDRFPWLAPPFAPPRPCYVKPPCSAPVAWRGYLFESLVLDQDGKPYAMDTNGDGKACENPSRFGFRAIPKVYGETGIYTVQMNEEGFGYARDLGFGAEAKPPQGNWEGGHDPTEANPPWVVR